MKVQSAPDLTLTQTPPVEPQPEADLHRRDFRVLRTLYFFYYCTFAVFTAYLNLYYRDLGLSGLQIGWLNAVIPAVGVICAPMWAMLNDRMSRPRTQLMIAAAGSLGAVLCLAIPRVFAWLLGLVAVFSLFNSQIMPLIDSTTLKLLGSRNTQYGQQRFWGSMGYIIAVWTAGQVVGALGLRWIFPMYTLAMLAFLGALTFLPRQRIQLQVAAQGGVLEMVKRPEWLFFAIGILTLGLSISGLSSFLGVSLKMMGGSDQLVGEALGLAAVSELPVMYFSKWFIQHIGLRRMLAIAVMAYAIRFALYALMPSPTWALAIGLTNGVTFGLYWVASVMVFNQLAPAHLKTTSQGLFLAITSLANMVGAPISGALLDRIGPAGLFGVYFGLAILALLVLLVGFRLNPNPENH